MIPTPTPSPTLLQVVSNSGAAPWWGVPVVAGIFLLVGGFATFLFTRANEDRKARRERTARRDEDVLEKGAQLLDSAEAIRDIGLLTLRRNIVDSVQLVATKGMPLIDEVKVRARRFSLVMPADFEEDFKNFLGWTLVLLSPPFQQEGQLHALDKQLEYSNALETRLRGLRELGPLSQGEKGDHSNVIKMAEKTTSILVDELAREKAEGNDKAPPSERSETEPK